MTDNKADPKEQKGKQFIHLSKISSENQHSAAYFFLTTVVALVIIELIRFVVQVNPIPGQLAYRIETRWELLPQGIGLVGSVFLVFESYRRIGLFVVDTQIGRVLTAFLCFLILLAIYVFAFSKPNYWVLVVGFNLLMVSVKCSYSLIHLIMILKKANIYKKKVSILVIVQLRRWLIRQTIFGFSLLVLGLWVYPRVLNTLGFIPVNINNGFPLTPVVMNSVILIMLFIFAGSSYYYSPTQKVTSFSKNRIHKLKTNLDKMYDLINSSGIKLYDL